MRCSTSRYGCDDGHVMGSLLKSIVSSTLYWIFALCFCSVGGNLYHTSIMLGLHFTLEQNNPCLSGALRSHLTFQMLNHLLGMCEHVWSVLDWHLMVSVPGTQSVYTVSLTRIKDLLKINIWINDKRNVNVCIEAVQQKEQQIIAYFLLTADTMSCAGVVIAVKFS